MALSACVEVVPSVWFLVPCVLALPITLLALARPALAPLSVLLVLPASWFFFDASVARLVPLLVVWVVMALAPRVHIACHFFEHGQIELFHEVIHRVRKISGHLF